MPKVLAGKKVSVLGSLDVPHDFSYLPDVARTLVTLATDERAWGRAWHVPNPPSITQRAAVQALARAAGTEARVTTVPWPAVRALGLFVPAMRELRETRYQFDRPFVADATRTTDTFGLTATSWDEAAAATVAWWRGRAPR
jgi:nucleoside-diphosphate-sugar epimerase